MGIRLGVFLGMVLISTATLTLEILQMRLFSVMLWHHLAYMVITVTLLGFGAAGAYVAVKGSGKTDEETRDKAGWACLLAALTTVIGLGIATRIPLDTYMETDVLQYAYIFLYYAFLIVPYFFMGLAITLLLSHFTKVVHKLYFYNLLGSALGCVLFLLLLTQLGGEGGTMATIALMALAAAPLFQKKSLALASAGVTLLFVLLVPVATSVFPVMPAPSKALGEFYAKTPDLTVESTEWNPVARIDVASAPSFSKLVHYHDAVVRKIFTIDGDAYTFLYKFDKPYPEVEVLGKTIYGSGYFFRPLDNVAVVGLGGGADIMTALHFQAKKITGIEINQAMLNAAENSYKKMNFKYNPYHAPGVTIVHEEGRSFMRRSEEKYDLIQMSGVDTWAATATGAYVLSENYLYTREAFEEYYAHLKPNGMLCMIRWWFKPPREELRLVTSQAEVLKARGITAPWMHFVVLGQNGLVAVVTKMTPFTNGDIQALVSHLGTGEGAVQVMYAPGANVAGNTNEYYRYFAAMKQGKSEQFIEKYPYKLAPVNDDRPFFFEFYKWGEMFKEKHGEGGYLVAGSPMGYSILLLSLLQALAIGSIFIIWPLWRFKRQGLKTDGAGGLIVYFAALGLAFMFVEVALMQKFVLFLGHPTYSIAVTMSSLLIFSGIGSFFAGKLRMEGRRMVLFATLAAAALVAVYAFALTPFFNALLGLPLEGRVATAVLALAPLGFLMGVPFPTGLAYARQAGEGFVAWAFGVNGVASVAASVLCIILALVAGFKLVLGVAVVMYLLAGLILATHRFPKETTKNDGESAE